MSVRRPPAVLAALLVSLAGCHKDQVTSYQVPKEAEPDFPAAAAGGGSAATSTNTGDLANAAVPQAEGAGLAWTAPAGWKPKPLSEMRKGSYAVGADGDMSITAFPGDVGGELANVNRWRGQIGLAPVDDSALPSVVDMEQENGLPMAIVDFGTAGGQRILGAIVPYGGNTWFFKLMGPDAPVEKAKADFLALLRTVRPAAGS